jgi:hypothetical protein
VHDEGQLLAMGGQVGGRGGVAAEADHDIHVTITQDRAHRVDRGTLAAGEAKECPSRLSRKWQPLDREQFVPTRGNEPCL